MNEDLQKILNDIVETTEQDHRKMLIESYIESRVERIAGNTRLELAPSIDMPVEIRRELDAWHKNQGYTIAYQVGEVLRTLLRRELLHEQ